MEFYVKTYVLDCTYVNIVIYMNLYLTSGVYVFSKICATHAHILTSAQMKDMQVAYMYIRPVRSKFQLVRQGSRAD